MNNTMATGNKYTNMHLCVCTNVSRVMKAHLHHICCTSLTLDNVKTKNRTMNSKH